MELFNGRPADDSGRLQKEIACYDLLDSLNIAYRRVDHAVAATMEDLKEADKALGALICKNLFLCNRQESDFYLLMMPADKVFKTKDLSKALGVSRLSFAKEEYMLSLMDLTPGSVTVLGLMNDKEKKVRLVIDEEVIAAKELGCHPCINTSSIAFCVDDFKSKLIPALGHNYTLVSLPSYEENPAE